MSVVRIPYLSRSEDAEGIQKCVSFVAREMALSEHTVALAMSYFFERLADEVSEGKVVRLPGFGVFAANYYASSSTMSPRFSPSRGFRHQVRMTAPVDDEGKKCLDRHRRKSSAQQSERVFTAQESFRDEIREQLKSGG
jgi:nucleoid DNA-binding protein